MIKRSAKRFLLNAENYVDFAARNPLIKHSAITENDISISKLEPNNSNSNIPIETVNIPHSIFALNRSTDQLPNKLNNFQ